MHQAVRLEAMETSHDIARGEGAGKEKVCVYTCLFGDEEKLLEQPTASTSECDFLCFTDKENLASSSWRITQVSPQFALDSPRSSRHPKILANQYLECYDKSLYIDNSVLLLRDPLEILGILLPEERVDIGLAYHSFRATLWDEFGIVQALGLDSADRINECLQYIMETCPDILKERPFWGGLIARRHHRQSVIKAMTRWWEMTLRFSRRDQLSLPCVINCSRLKVHAEELDNHNSEYFKWPCSTRHRTNYGKTASFTGTSRLIEVLAECEMLKDEVQRLRTENSLIKHDLDRVSHQLNEAQANLRQMTLSLNACSSNSATRDRARKKLMKLLLSQSWRMATLSGRHKNNSPCSPDKSH